MKGRAIKILHHFPDPLWAAGDKSSPGNGSFRPERVFPLENEDDAEDAGGGVAKKKSSTESTAAEGANGASPSLASEIDSMSLADDARATRGAPGGAPGAVSSSLPVIDVSTPAGMDAMFERCFLAGLRDKLADADLPMRCELFYANCVLPSRPADVTLDLKKSSFKKQAKLFAVLEKKKLIATKAIHKQDNIVSVNRDHAAYLEYCAAADAAEAAAGASGGGAAGAEPRGADAFSLPTRLPPPPRPSTSRWRTARRRCTAPSSATSPWATRTGCTTPRSARTRFGRTASRTTC